MLIDSVYLNMSGTPYGRVW